MGEEAWGDLTSTHRFDFHIQTDTGLQLPQCSEKGGACVGVTGMGGGAMKEGASRYQPTLAQN